MALAFPNPSRSYDASRHGVWFWGYDNAREISFLVDDRVLLSFDSAPCSDEAGVLASFDRHRDEILKIAMALYAEGQQTLYVLH
ncbi:MULTISPECIES: DUF1488 domain-containing protein [Cupriavidus]|uniref:DUF1488 domain-containing protein n=1 Tax=Cupriavidus oxalaticus TaxID=96344 RepID=A0A4V1BYU1_9BURK|nr:MULTISPECIES: DUF1488 domain-containing protein [Cupriavidus]MBF6991219.1 DUF1488 domain-containing protein [Cupriavidus sp. IK-TO18]QBY53002.1 DUF1488 domain-containing protein [Cupriavidus oxalaticus]TDF59534.1 DUF1488 domain-containing protein [Cupriavidus sp. L7L]